MMRLNLFLFLALSAAVAVVAKGAVDPKCATDCPCPVCPEGDLGMSGRSMPIGEVKPTASQEGMKAPNMGWSAAPTSIGRRRRSANYYPGGSSFGYQAGDSDWEDLGDDNSRLSAVSRIFRARNQFRRQFDNYGSPIKIKNGHDSEYGYNFPRFERDHYFNYPEYAEGYGDPYQHFNSW
jgi:hypothetical protein